MAKLEARRITDGLGTQVVGVALVRQAPSPVGSSLSGTGEGACATVPAGTQGAPPAQLSGTQDACATVQAVAVHEEIDSTNLEALRRAKAGAAAGLVVVAETQTAGRGRPGRTWADVPGGCLLFSVLLRPPVGAEGLLTAAAALSVAEAVRGELELPAEIKWPNDLMLRGRKFGGVLAESAGGELAAVGIGINVSGRPSDLPEELRETATFLCPRCDVRLSLLRAVLRRLDDNYLRLREGDAAQIVKRAEGLDCVIGRTVEVVAGSETVGGRAVGWGETGTLLLRDTAGQVREFEAGEVTLC